MSNAAGRFWDEFKNISISLTLFVFLALGDIIFTMNFFSISTFAALSITSVISTVYAEDVLLIPNSLGDNVWAFSPFDGSLISNNFIPSDGHLSQPIEIVVTPFETKLPMRYSNTPKAELIYAPSLDQLMVSVVRTDWKWSVTGFTSAHL